MMPIKNAQGEIEANLFYVSYTLDGTTDVSKRPLTVAFNGGPGVGVGLAAHGLHRAEAREDDGRWSSACRALQLVDNDNTWLDQTDLVFVDPVGTGYSRAASGHFNDSSTACKATSNRSANSSASI